MTTSTKKHKESSNTIVLKGAIAGGIAGILDKLLTHPFDYVTTQIQLDKDKQIYNGPMDCIRKTLAKRGFLGFYRGMGILLLANIPKVASRYRIYCISAFCQMSTIKHIVIFIRFAVFEYLNYNFEDEKGDVVLSRSFMAGLLAGLAEAILFVTPMEVIKVTVLSRPELSYKNLNSVLWDIVKHHGIIKQSIQLILYRY